MEARLCDRAAGARDRSPGSARRFFLPQMPHASPGRSEHDAGGQPERWALPVFSHLRTAERVVPHLATRRVAEQASRKADI
jgi:hypothetical protein